MNKKQILGAFAMAAFALTLMTSCDKSKSQADDQAADAKVAPTETKIAFVEVDSIMTQYQFCKEYSLVLQKKGQNIQNTLAQKQQQLEAAAANFQQKLQQNAYTREQAQGIQAHDITNDVIAGLNKAYKSAPELKTAGKDTKKKK